MLVGRPARHAARRHRGVRFRGDALTWAQRPSSGGAPGSRCDPLERLANSRRAQPSAPSNVASRPCHDPSGAARRTQSNAVSPVGWTNGVGSKGCGSEPGPSREWPGASNGSCGETDANCSSAWSGECVIPPSTIDAEVAPASTTSVGVWDSDVAVGPGSAGAGGTAGSGERTIGWAEWVVPAGIQRSGKCSTVSDGAAATVEPSATGPAEACSGTAE